MVVLLMLNVCETLLDSVSNYFKQDKRTNAELHDKLHQMFEDNVAEFQKYIKFYQRKMPFSIYDKVEYEHYVIENYKKSIYGDSYEIKEYKD